MTDWDYEEKQICEKYSGYKAESLIWKLRADHRLELLREGLEATKCSDGHWSDRVRWMNWVDKVEKELLNASD